jgi:hypothetical protein
MALKVGDPVCVHIIRHERRCYEPGVIRKATRTRRITVEILTAVEDHVGVFNPDGSCRGNPLRSVTPMTAECADEMDRQNLAKYVRAVTGLSQRVDLCNETLDTLRSIVENDVNVLKMKKAKEADGKERTGDTAGPQPEDGGGP